MSVRVFRFLWFSVNHYKLHSLTQYLLSPTSDSLYQNRPIIEEKSRSRSDVSTNRCKSSPSLFALYPETKFWISQLISSPDHNRDLTFSSSHRSRCTDDCLSTQRDYLVKWNEAEVSLSNLEKSLPLLWSGWLWFLLLSKIGQSRNQMPDQASQLFIIEVQCCMERKGSERVFWVRRQCQILSWFIRSHSLVWTLNSKI